MKLNIKDLPTPLKAVCTVNSIAFLTAGIEMIIDFSVSRTEDKIVSGAALAITLFIVLGVFEKSRLLRIFALVLSWPTAVISLVSLPFAYSEIGIESLWILYNLVIVVVTILGLMSREAKVYYGITNDKKPA